METHLHYEISQFLYKEAYLLDHRQYLDWLELLTEDIKYVMPLRVTVDNKTKSNFISEMSYFTDTKEDITMKVERLYTKSAWVDNPAPRQRHFISNVMIEPTIIADEYKVRSYFLFKRSRASEINTEELFGEREDIIRRENGEWKIAQRTVYPDQAVLTVMNISMFL
ncbi:3-phenylpropionate/cinnamic acid dioxygenase subunit beta [Neobacillus sp. WH10]|uniref:3-phenylpropionate/cinnamic acid dioxygenase subunit beta n=1 Tax=Neobacillus sp. WH10 TaxID=3047873 RepID=UPI0024C1A8C6|nr:3-phenylpropionate/cinnamic acid dioxygenase subunit beta [Neobacillus sp. WH10]WHY79414.1 3-phenylpropionate/cinnamic acid dioxygenase subunit beta [Neobacillus sp. WH10]